MKDLAVWLQPWSSSEPGGRGMRPGKLAALPGAAERQQQKVKLNPAELGWVRDPRLLFPQENPPLKVWGLN